MNNNGKEKIISKKKDLFFEIISGPSKSLLFDSVKYAYQKGACIPIDFTVICLKTGGGENALCHYFNFEYIKVTGIEHEDGSGDSFNIHGYCTLSSDDFFITETIACRFKAYYNAKKRSGVMWFID